MTIQAITGLGGHMQYMQAETAEASDWLHVHINNVHDVTAGGPAGNTRDLAALEGSRCRGKYQLLFC